MLPDLSNDIRCAVPKSSGGGFLASGLKQHEEFMKKDLARSGLTPGQMRCYVDEVMGLSKGAKGGYYIPYFWLDGTVMRGEGRLLMYRIRQYGCEQRYSQPSSQELAQYELPVNIPYVLPQAHEYIEQTKTLYICEGEKKAACVIDKLHVGAIGIGGCWNWGVKKKLHPWIKKLLEAYSVERVVVIPDGDIRRYDICTAYGTLADELAKAGVEVAIVKMPAEEHGIDDLLVQWGPEAAGAFEELGKLPAASLVVSQSSLAEQYGLSTSANGNVIINDMNVRRLLEEHPTFAGLFWLNADTNEYMFGEEVIHWGVTDLDITCHMQHYFQLYNLNKQRVIDSIASLCEKNKKSPFMDWVGGTAWDGVDRLSDWPIRLWGCENSAVVREVAEKYWVGMYARMASPGCKMDWMLVTVGAQGIGKSWFAELVSRGHNVTFMASGNARDDAAKMHRGLVICIDELDAFNKREATYWKTMLSTNVDTYRPPYGRGEVTMKRRSVLYGTSNHETFLRHDDTGHRRFGVLKPTQMLDVEGLRAELQQLWAEAAYKYGKGEVDYHTLSYEVRSAVEEGHSGGDELMEELELFIAAVPADTRGNKKFRGRDVMKHLREEGLVQGQGMNGLVKDKLGKLGAVYKTVKWPDGSVSKGFYISNE